MKGGKVSVLIAIIIFSVIVLFHELGHFLFAKANNVRVNEFSLGLGPTIWGFKKGETKYSIKALPFGGACMMEGEDEESNDGRAFNNASILGRMSIVFAGPFFNFIMAFVFATIVIMAVGYDKPTVMGISDNSAAQEASIKAGDEIVAMNNKKIHFFSEIGAYSIFHPGEKVDVTFVRNGKEKHASLTPKYSKEYKTYMYGFMGGDVEKKPTLIDSAKHGVYKFNYYIYTTFESLRLMVTGKVSVNDLSGPVGIVKSMGDTYNSAKTTNGLFVALISLLNYATMLSANLGIMNLLPLPALDGGRLLFLIF